MAFPFEDLEVYRRSIQLFSDLEPILERPDVTRTVADQLSRAALSIPLNIAEGNGRWHAGDKRNFFWIARGSTLNAFQSLKF